MSSRRAMAYLVALALGVVACSDSAAPTPAAATVTVVPALATPTAASTLAPTATSTSGGIPVVDLTTGQCFDIGPGTTLGSSVATVRPCADPHSLEMITMIQLPPGLGTKFPGKAVIDQYADPACAAAFEAYVGRPDTESIYNYAYLTMTQAEWDAGERRVPCGAGSDTRTRRSEGQ